MAKKLQLVNGLPIMMDEAAAATPYDQSIYYASGLAANTNITLPNSGSFNQSDKKCFFEKTGSANPSHILPPPESDGSDDKGKIERRVGERLANPRRWDEKRNSI
jgi:hypothetical protein